MKSFFQFIGLLVVFSTVAHSKVVRVSDANMLREAVAQAQPGDEIILVNGVWENAELLVKGEGSEVSPIVVRAETPGKVIITGNSNLRIAGEYLSIEGLVFKAGQTPTIEVISFKEKNGIYANNCRLTACVIEDFNPFERFEPCMWVVLYGKNNRVDHCSFSGKRGSGVTLVVKLSDENCQENNHRIDHNYFGFRQNLGSNGGETLRVGTSKYSLTTSGTLIENNLFEHCSGETEIVSIKSCGNTFRHNTILECQGAVVFRHGNDNRVESNHFIGNGVPHTGGVRVINQRNSVVNNHFSGLTGQRFRGAVVLMNGVPNSPINRYHQVVGAEVSNNTFERCRSIQLCAGSDEERSLTPVETHFSNNHIIHDYADELFAVHDDISGIEFSGNVVSGPSAVPTFADGFILSDGIRESVGAKLEFPPLSHEDVGPQFWKWKDMRLEFDTGGIVTVEPGLNTLEAAIVSAKPGQVLELVAGYYHATKKMLIKSPITIRSEKGAAIITSKRAAMFEIENMGALKLQGVTIDGSKSPDRAGNYVVKTSKYSMNRNYRFVMENCVVQNLDVNHSYHFFRSFPSTMADEITIRDCEFSNITGSVFLLNQEREALGKYNAENISIQKCHFRDIKGAVLSVLRGGTDESTFGPKLKLTESVFENTGGGKRNDTKSVILLHGVQKTEISDCEFTDCRALTLELTNGDPVTNIHRCSFIRSDGIVSNSDQYQVSEIRTSSINKPAIPPS